MLLVFLFPLLAQAFTYQVLEVRGSQAYVSSQGSATPSKLLPQATVSDGDTVQTRERTAVFLLSSSGHKINLGPSSSVFLDSGHDDQGSYVVANLLNGNLQSVVNGQGTKKKKYELKTRSASVGVRGTEFLSRLNGNSLEIFLKEGTLELPGGKELTGGKKAAMSGGAVSEVSPLSSGEYQQQLETSGLIGSFSTPAEPSPKETSEVSGKTELMRAIERKDLATIKALLAGGADKQAKDSSGRNAYDYAQATANKEIQDLLFR